jgi:VIT1/CCC1 family predicted Fe2+/Mn2+ transporter
MATEVMQNPEAALQLHAREELGIDPAALGSPWRASSSSLAAFSAGALVPLLPWFWPTSLSVGLSIGLGAAASLGVGAATGVFSGRGPIRPAIRQLLVTTLAAGVTFAVGRVIG